jgi:hypothetical protein
VSALETKSSIFRASALQQRARNEHKVEFPRLFAPNMFKLLWLLLALLLGIIAFVGRNLLQHIG